MIEYKLNCNSRFYNCINFLFEDAFRLIDILDLPNKVDLLSASLTIIIPMNEFFHI